MCEFIFFMKNNYCSLVTGWSHTLGEKHRMPAALDVMCTCSDLPAPKTDILHASLSDYCPLWRVSPFVHPLLVNRTTNFRLWQSFDTDIFLANQHLDGDAWQSFTTLSLVNCLTCKYQLDELVAIIDCHACDLAVTVIEWSWHWGWDQSREMFVMPAHSKTFTRLLTWPASQHCQYVELLHHQKCFAFWTECIDISKLS